MREVLLVKELYPAVRTWLVSLLSRFEDSDMFEGGSFRFGYYNPSKSDMDFFVYVPDEKGGVFRGLLEANGFTLNNLATYSFLLPVNVYERDFIQIVQILDIKSYKLQKENNELIEKHIQSNRELLRFVKEIYQHSELEETDSGRKKKVFEYSGSDLFNMLLRSVGK